MADNDSTGFSITSTIGESGWEWSVGCYHAENKAMTQAVIEAAIIVPRIELCGNSIQTAKSENTGTENPLNWVVVLVTTFQIVSSDYHGSQTKIYIAGSYDAKVDSYAPFVRQPSLGWMNHNSFLFERPTNVILHNWCMGLNVRNWLHQAQPGFEINK